MLKLLIEHVFMFCLMCFLTQTKSHPSLVWVHIMLFKKKATTKFCDSKSEHATYSVSAFDDLRSHVRRKY